MSRIKSVKNSESNKTVVVRKINNEYTWAIPSHGTFSHTNLLGVEEFMTRHGYVFIIRNA